MAGSTRCRRKRWTRCAPPRRSSAASAIWRCSTISAPSRSPGKSRFGDSMIALQACAGSPTVVLATGDPMWFGVGATLTRHVDPAEMRVLPSPSAFQLAAAALCWPLADCQCLTVHGRPLEAVSRHLSPGARLLIYSADGSSPQALARLLTGRGYGPSRIVVCEHLGGTRERIRATVAADFDLAGIADLNTVAVECVAGRAAEPRPLVPGLARRRLRPRRQDDQAESCAASPSRRCSRCRAQLLWDVGAGSARSRWNGCARRRGMAAIAIEPRRGPLRAWSARTRRRSACPSFGIVEGDRAGRARRSAGPGRDLHRRRPDRRRRSMRPGRR